MFELEVIASDRVSQELREFLSEEEFDELLRFLLENPLNGKLIKGTGGLRKLRWKVKKLNRGKRGGIRIIYYLLENVMIILLKTYSKSDQDDLTEKQKKTILLELNKTISKIKTELL